MKSQKIIVVLAGLLLCTTMGWTQNFGTTVQGAISAIPCPPPVPYYLQGKGDISSPPDYQQTCKTDNGSSFASASSQASLVTNEIANATTQNGGSAASNAEAIQTATLFPPKGFNGNSILVSYTDIYAMTLSGVGQNALGEVSVCWQIAQLKFKDCHVLSANGKPAGKLSHQFILKKSQSGFKLTILKAAGTDLATYALGTSVTGGAITTSNPHLILPKGWTCKYDSGTKCP